MVYDKKGTSEVMKINSCSYIISLLENHFPICIKLKKKGGPQNSCWKSVLESHFPHD